MKPRLPIDDHLEDIAGQLRSRGALIVSASPGAGKTTRLPPFLLKDLAPGKQIWVLEPRRIAAVSAAARIAEENSWTLGREVGYQVRFDHKSSNETRLLFLTEALLMRKLLGDPELSKVACVVLDEFHERSLHVDLALAALQELRELARPDLQIVVMSATLDARPLSRYLKAAPIVEVPGRVFPQDIHFEDRAQLLRTGPEFTERMAKLTARALRENAAGDVLVFLPGRGEIERLRAALTGLDAEVLPLHGQLSLAEQRRTLEPLTGRRKIVLATNVAESSLTVEGVSIVVDSGLARLAQIHPRTGFSSLDLVRISKASATQRAGRAARTGPGVVYRAWSTHDELSMKPFESPEIERSDLAETLLLLAALGVSNFESFSWFEAPAGKSVAQARQFLRDLGALDEHNRLTPLGSELREFPVHPRIAKLLLRGEQSGFPWAAAELATLLSEKSPFSSASFGENDLLSDWEQWQRTLSQPASQRLTRVAEQLFETLGVAREKKRPDLATWAPQILFEIYPDRLCRRRRPQDPAARMVGGRGVRLHPGSAVKESEFFLALELGEGRTSAETTVYRAVGVPSPWLRTQIKSDLETRTRIEWDDEKKRFWAIDTEEWHGLSVGNENPRPAKSEEIADQLVELAVEKWDLILQKNEALAQWLKRLQFLKKNDARWPEFTDHQVRKALEMACYQETSLNVIFEKDLIGFFEGELTPEHRSALARECPTHWALPTGNRNRIEYTEEQGAQCEVRLQELFGLNEAPKIAGQSLTLILLAPNYRPVQVTRDLASFWQNGYPEVRKEMRSRYPKHSWPDDPLTAPPQAKGRRQ